MGHGLGSFGCKCGLTRTLTQRPLNNLARGLRDAGASQGPPQSVPRPPGPGIVLNTKRPVPYLTPRGPHARSCDPRAGPQICPSPKQWIFLHTACAREFSPVRKPCAPAVSQFKTAYKCCFKASQPTVHSSGAIFVKRRESSQKPCAPGFRCC